MLRGGGALLNVASMTAAERAELEAEQEDARGLVVVRAGLAPGVTTLVAAELLLAHPEADAMEVVMTFSAATAGGRAGAAFGYRLLTGAVHHPTVRCLSRRRSAGDAVLMSAWRPKGGSPRLRGARHAPAHLPRGASHRRGVAHPERLRLLWVLPRVAFVGGRRTIPPELTREPICEWVAVSRGGRRLGATIVVRANLRTVSGRA